MVDLETTGTNAEHCNILQLAGVAFNPFAGTVSNDMFCQSMYPRPTRYWDEDTRNWWNKRPDVLAKVRANPRMPAEVMQAFQAWVLKHTMPGEPIYFWAKPTTFDFNFVESYFRELEIISPFHFRTVIDMRSFLIGRLGTKNFDELAAFEKKIQFQGIEHDARFDALHQIRIVMESLKPQS